jgi:SAM-dependent methyltransferase
MARRRCVNDSIRTGLDPYRQCGQLGRLDGAQAFVRIRPNGMGEMSIRSLIGKAPGVGPVYHAWLRWRNHRRDHREYLLDFAKFELANKPAAGRPPLRWSDKYPILGEKTPGTAFEPHYLYHVSWAARVLARSRPALHIDIASSLFFSAIVSAFMPIEFYDYRPANVRLSGLQSKAGDLMRLPFGDASVASLSCMHVIEHIGLGRYGDPIDPDGDLKAIVELKRVLAAGGQLLFVTPIGRPRICFNAHRIYSYRMIIDLFSDLWLEEFMLLTDDAIERGPIENATEAECDRQNYGCGCFLFRRGRRNEIGLESSP